MNPSLALHVSPARLARREHIIKAAKALMGAQVGSAFDPFRSDLCPIDIVMVAGSPWLRDGLERDFSKDPNGYRKLGGAANSPERAYFFRSAPNLIHYLKRVGFYIPRGEKPGPAPGMACFFDWDEDRGRYNFSPDGSGVVMEVDKGHVTKVALAVSDEDGGYGLQAVTVDSGTRMDMSIIGFSDLP